MNRSSEQRKHARHDVEVEARVYTASGWQRARSRDLSRGGICLIVEQPIPQGAEIALQVRLVFPEEGESEPLELRARVVWCTPVPDGHQIGASFIELTHESLGYIDAFLYFLAQEREDEEQPTPAPPKGRLFE